MSPQNPLELQQAPNSEPVQVYPSGVPPFPRVPQCPFGEIGEVGSALAWLLIEPVVDSYVVLMDMFIDTE